MILLNELYEDVVLSDAPLVKTLFDKHDTVSLAVGLKKGVTFPKHSTSTPAILHVIEGEISFETDDECKELKAFDSFDVPIDTPHWVIASSHAIFILTKRKSQE